MTEEQRAWEQERERLHRTIGMHVGRQRMIAEALAAGDTVRAVVLATSPVGEAQDAER